MIFMIFMKRTAVTTATASEYEPVVSLFFAKSPPLFFLNAATLRDAKSCNHRDGLLRARDPVALALQRIVERSHTLDIMILHRSIELQLCFHAAHPP